MKTLVKPAGIPVFPPGDSVLTRLLAAEPAREAVLWPPGFEGGIVHRLDTGTSGALLVADSPAELIALRALFAERRLVKTYRMLAAKDVPWTANFCERPIAHDAKKKQRMVVQRGPETPHRGKWYPADTRFRKVHGRVWEVEIRTGVMHQIRVHAAFVGIPIAGDRLYGGGDGELHLHHVGLVGGGVQTEAVPLPEWAE